MSTPDKTLAENVCKVIGHQWDFPKCSRCGCVCILSVSINGVMLEQNLDYVQEDDKITLIGQGLHGTVKILVGMTKGSGPWGILEREAVPGGTTVFEVNDILKT